MRPLLLRGVVPAHLMPFTPDLAVDAGELRRHLDWLLRQPIGGLTCNAHASEVAALDRAERQLCLQIAVEAAGGRVPVVGGVYADATREAVEMARDAERGGADALLVFPSPLFAEQRRRRDEMVLAHYAAIASAVDLPLVVFEYRRATGCHYGPELLARLIEEIPSIAAVKEWSLDIVDFEDNLRAVRAASRPVSVLSSFSTSLMATLALGADGILSGHGSVVADLQCAIFRAVAAGDMEQARRVNDRLHILTRAVYADPFQDGHNRMKFALRLLGRQRGYAVRPPLQPIPERERERIRESLVAAGLLGAAADGVGQAGAAR